MRRGRGDVGGSVGRAPSQSEGAKASMARLGVAEGVVSGAPIGRVKYDLLRATDHEIALQFADVQIVGDGEYVK